MKYSKDEFRTLRSIDAKADKQFKKTKRSFFVRLLPQIWTGHGVLVPRQNMSREILERGMNTNDLFRQRRNHKAE